MTHEPRQAVYRQGQWVDPDNGQPVDQQSARNAWQATRPVDRAQEQPQEHSVVQLAGVPLRQPVRTVTPGAIPAGLAAQPRVLAQPSTPVPKPVADAGFAGSIGDFNNKVQAVHDAYTQRHGVRPSPGIVFDVIRSPIPETDYSHLFNWIPQSPSHAQAIRVASQHPADQFEPNHDEILRGLDAAIRNGTQDVYIAQHPEQVSAVLRERGLTLAEEQRLAISTRGPQAEPMTPGYREPPAPTWQQQLDQEAAYSGFIRGGPVKGIPHFFNEYLAPAVGQVAFGITLGPPTLAYQEAKLFTKPPMENLRGQVAIGRQIIKGAEEDIRDPTHNAGNLALDAFASLTLGTGAAVRLAAAARAGSLAEAASALARRPPAGTFEIRFADRPAAQQLLSDNAFYRQIQRAYLSVRQAGLDLRAHDLGELERMPSGASAAVAHILEGFADMTRHPLSSQFSMENKIGRIARAQMETDRALKEAARGPVMQAAHSALGLEGVKPWKRALSDAEQKAIQVLFTDVTGGPQAQARAWRVFHEKMIDWGEGDPADHRRQLGLVQQVSKLLADPGKQRPRFRRALEDTRNLVDLMEAVKYDMNGLLPEVKGLAQETAEARVARVGVMLRAAEKASSIEEFDRLVKEGAAAQRTRVTPESRYVPFTSTKVGQARPQQSIVPAAGSSPFGVSFPTNDPSLTHEFHGVWMRNGDMRWDTSNLEAHAAGSAFRKMTKIQEWRRLHDLSVAAKPEGREAAFYVPIRSKRSVSQELRQVINDEQLGVTTNPEKIQRLIDQDTDQLQTHLFPSTDDLERGKVTLKDVQWVDKRTFAEQQRGMLSPGGKAVRQVFLTLNEPVKAVKILARPAYMLNALGNSGMLLFDEGLMAIPNFLKAVRASEHWDVETERMLDALGGESHTQATNPAVNWATKLSNSLGRFWNPFTDRVFRRAAAIHYLRRAGVRDADIPNVLRAAQKGDKDSLATVTDVRQRAQKSVVQMSNMTWAEREWLRHIIFVYPWMRGATVWSLRSLIEHPVKSALLAEFGKETEKELPEILRQVPEWFKAAGYFPVGWTHDGKPKVVNPASVNTFSTWAQMLAVVDGQGRMADLLGPGADVALHFVENTDRFGRKYHGYRSYFVGPITDQLRQTPYWAAVTRATQPKPVPQPFDITNERALIQREHSLTAGKSKRPIFVPEGFWASFAPLAIGGLHERVLDTEALQARFWRSQPKAKRLAHEKELLNKMLALQVEVTGRPLPHEVVLARDFAFDLTERLADRLHETGVPTSTRDEATVTINLLKEKGWISRATQNQLVARMASITTDDIDRFRKGVLAEYAHGKAASRWQRDVGVVAQFTSPTLGDIHTKLERLGISNTPRVDRVVSQKALWEYGRQYLAFREQVARFGAAIKGAKTPAEQAGVRQRLAAFMEEQDKPVVVAGSTLPSFPRTDVGKEHQQQLDHQVKASAGQPWASLTTLDKEMLGVKVARNVGEAWAVLDRWMKEARSKLPVGGTLPVETRDYYAKTIAKKVPGFAQDYARSQLILADRVKVLKPVLESSNRELWDELLGYASSFYTRYLHAGWSKTQLVEQWRKVEVERVQAAISGQPGFASEVGLYGRGFLDGLVSP